jgi:capsular polysaccharide biosynthesis protein
LFKNRVKENQERILIFGTGAGGSYLYKSIHHKKNIVGFLDNNVQKQGTDFLGTFIYSPNKIAELTFDKIIIASDYYLEIIQQLTHELNVDSNKVEFFHSASQESASFIKYLFNKVDTIIKNLLCHPSKSISHIVYRFINTFSNYLENSTVIELNWLDKNVDNRVHTFRETRESISYGPSFITKKQESKVIIIPEICLYQFKNTQMMTTSGTVITEDNIAISARVPSANSLTADYASGNVIYHSNKRALVRRFSPLSLEKGISISAYSDLNYYHWLLEVLSKIQFLNELPIEYKDYPILVPKQLTNIKNIEIFFSYFKVHNPIVYLESNYAYQVENLLVITSPNYMVANLKGRTCFQIDSNYCSAESLNYIREIALSNINKSQSKTYDRVFLARKNYIRSYNQNNIQKLLLEYDFKSICLEDLTFDEQVRVINQAKYIVGPTGAAWTNLLFAEKGTKALCWMAKEYGDLSCFSNIAKNTGVQLDYIEYVTGANNTRELYYRPYTVNTDQISKWLKENIN